MLTTFPQHREFDKTRRRLDDLGLSYEVISPEPAYSKIGVPALKVEAETRMAFEQWYSSVSIALSGLF